MAFDWLRSLRLILSMKPRRIRKSRRSTRFPAVIDTLENRRMLSAQDITLTSTTLYQYQGIGSNVGVFGTDDPNPGNQYSYSLVNGIGGDDNSSVEIKSFGSASFLVTSQTFDANVKDTYSIGVRATDQYGDTVDKVLTLTVSDSGPTSVFLDGYGNGRQLTLPEVADTSRPISFGTLTTSDGNFASHQLYLSGPDAADFQISGNQLQFIPGLHLDRQNQSAYQVTVDGDVGASFTLFLSLAASKVTEFGYSLGDRFAVATNAKGNSVSVYGANSNDGPTLFFVQDASFAIPFEGPIRVNSTTGWSHFEAVPAVALNSSGDFVIAWQDTNNATQSHQIRARRFDSHGHAIGDEITVASLPNTGQATPLDVSISSSGQFVVTWTRSTAFGSSDPGIYAREFDSAGAAQGSEFKVNTTSSFDQGLPTVAMDAVGNFVIAWQSNVILAQRFDSAGNAVGDNFQVSGTSGGDPSISMNPTGDFIITWDSPTPDGYDIHGRRYDSAGNAIADEFRVNQFDAGWQIRSHVSINDAGGFAITWASEQQDGDGFGTFAQIYNADGSILSREFLVNDVTTGTQLPNGIAYNSIGDLIVAWNGDGSSGNNEYLQRYRLPERVSSSSVIQVSSTSFPEDQVSGTGVATLSTNASNLVPDATTFSLVNGLGGDDNSVFQIVGNQLNFIGVANYKTQSLYHVRVRATTDDGRVFENLVEFHVLQVNHPPAGVTVSALIPYLAEDADTSHPITVATLAAIDDGVGTNVLSLSGPDADSFQIVGDQLQLIAGVTLNVADQSTYLVTINVSDPSLSPAVLASSTYALRIQLPQTNVATVPYTAGDPGPTIASDANGNFVVVWHTTANNGSSPSLRAQRYNASGIPLGSQIIVGSTGFPELPTIAMDSSGDFVIAWVEHQPNFKTVVFARRFDSGGNPLGSEFQVSSSSSDNIPRPSIALDSSGGFVITWSSYQANANEFDVYARRYSPTGAAMGAEFLVNTTTAGFQSFSAVAIDSQGHFTITWSGTGADDNNGIYARRYDTDGSPLGAEFLVNAYTAGIEVAPAITTTSTGDTVIVWASSDHDNGHAGIYGQRFGSDGQAVGTEFQINNVTLPDLYQPDIAIDAAGNFVVTWSDGTEKIFARRFNSQGVPDSPQIQINDQPSTSFVRQPFIDATDSGQFVITWGSFDGDTYARNVFAQRFPIPRSDRGPVNFLLGPHVVAENSAAGTTVGTLSSQDRDPTQTTFSYQLVDGLGSDDNTSFAISGDQLITQESFDFETKSSYSLRVRITDGYGKSVEKRLTVQVLDVNEAPTDLSLSSTTVGDNSPVGTSVGYFGSVDPDTTTQTFTYTLVDGVGSDDNASFVIVDNQLRTNALFDIPSKNTYSILVRTTDQNGLSYDKPLTITVIDGNDAPTDIQLSSASVFENLPVGSLVGQFSSSDPDSIPQSFTYGLVDGTGGNDNGSFFIDGDELKTNSSFNYESGTTYSILVRTTDQGGLYFDKQFTITILDANDAPTDIQLDSDTVSESASLGTAIGTLSSTDPDSAPQTFTYSLGSGIADNDQFTIVDNQLQTAASFDFETRDTYTIVVTTTDQSGLSFDKSFTVHVLNSYEAPSIVSSQFSVPENTPAGTLVGTISHFIDASVTAPVFTILSGNGFGSGAFAISSAGVVTVADPSQLDFEARTQFNVTVQLDDGVNQQTTSIVINLSNVNEAPNDIEISSNTLPENAGSLHFIGHLTSNDPDAGDTASFALVTGTGSSDNAQFKIVNNDLYALNSFDFETRNRYFIRIGATDQGGLSYEQQFAINVTNVAEAPTNLQLSSTTVAENLPEGTVVGLFNTVDPDTNSVTFSYSLEPGNDAASFTIAGNELRTATSFDFETKQSYVIVVRTTDSTGLSYDAVFTIRVTNVYEVPTLTSNSFTIPENTNTGTVVGTVAAWIDSSRSNPVFSILTGNGTGAGAFAIDNYGVITVADSSQLDFESTPTFSITVQIDDGITRINAEQTIHLLDVNEAPVNLFLDGKNVDENKPAGTLIGTFRTNDPDTPQPFQYSLVSGTGSDDNSSFVITGDQLFTAASFDYETKNYYSLRVRTTDSGGLTFEKVFSISVNDINEVPTDIVLSSNSIAENQAAGATVGVLSAIASSAQTFTYSLVPGNGDDDNASFSIIGNELRAGITFDYEVKTTYLIRLRATDQNGLFLEKSFTVLITNVDEAPTNLTLSSTTVAENQPLGTTVGTLSSTDPDTAELFVYHLVSGPGSDDNGFFDISGNRLVTAARFDFESRSTYQVRIRTTDSGGLTFERAVLISISDANDAPTDIALSASTVLENAPQGTVVGLLTATDPDSAPQSFSYQLTTGEGSDFNSSFTIVGNELRTAKPLNFESSSNDSIRIRVTDNGGLSFDKILNVNVTDVNEAPIALDLSTTSIDENVPGGSTVGTFTSTDPDLTGQSFIYSLISGTGSNDNSSFAIVGNELRTTSSFDFETKNTYSIRVRSTDQGGLSFERTFSINVNDVPEPPTNLTLSASVIADHQGTGAVVGRFTTSDQDFSDTFTYSLVSGLGSNDNASFTIVGDQLKTTTDFDAAVQSQYSIRVQTSDQTGLTFERTFTISVTATRGVPTDLQLSSDSISENSSIGSLVGTFSTVERNGSTDTFTYTLVSGLGSDDNSRFRITNGQLLTAENLDFETRSTLLIRVRTTNQSGQSLEKAFNIHVTDVAEAPTSLSLSAASVDENSPVGTVVGILTGVDPDLTSQSLTYRLVTGVGSDGNNCFRIVGNQLQTAAVFDAETTSSYSIRIRTTDDTGLSLDRVFSIIVNNVYEIPTLTSNTFTIPENSVAGTVVGSVATTIDASRSNLAFSILSGNGSGSGAFALDSHGVITVADPSQLDFESTAVFTITIQIDDGITQVAADQTIQLIDVNEAPVDLLLDVRSVDENRSSGTFVGAFRTNDPDAAQAFRYSLVSGAGSADNSSFVISGNQLFTAAGFDYETKNTYSIRVRTTDAGGLTLEKVFSISVTDVNEAPTALNLSATSIAENLPGGSTVGTFSSADPDLTTQSFTYSLISGAGSNDNSSFAIVGNELRTTSSFDFETKNTYFIRVRSTDQGGLSFERTFSIAVSDAPEPPTNLTLSTSTISDHQGSGAVVGTFTTTDPDLNDTFTYSLVSGVGSSDNGSFTIAGNQLKTTVDLDATVQSQYTVRVRTTDQTGLTFERAFAIRVVSSDGIPTDIQLSSSTIAENSSIGSLIGTFSTVERNSGTDTFTYLLISGTGSDDNSSFRISNGQLLTGGTFDFETKNLFSVRVRTTNQSGQFFEKSLNITVTDVAEAPMSLTLSATSIDENSPSGTVVGILTGVDPDLTSQSLTYSLVTGVGSDGNDRFRIVGNQLQTAEAFDAETTSRYSIRIRTTDDTGLSLDRVFSIAVNNIYEAPTLAAASFSIPDHTQNNSSVGRLLATFDSSISSVSYSIISGNGKGAFAISNTGVLAVADSSLLDFSTTPQFNLIVQLNDGVSTVNAPVTVTITFIDRSPVLSGTSAVTYTEGQNATAVNPSILVSDAYRSTLSSATIAIANYVAGEDVLSFTSSPATGNIAGTFDASSGVMSLTSAGAAATIGQFQAALAIVSYQNTSNNPSSATRQINYRVSDGTLSSNTVTSTVAVKPVNNAPLISQTTDLTYREGQAATAVSPAIVISDVDNLTLFSATARLTSGFNVTQDVLSFTNDGTTMGNIVGTYDALAGVMTLTSAGASATVGQFQSAMRSITYRNTSNNPTVSRVVSFQVTDGGRLSDIATSRLTIVPVNTAPVLSGSSTITVLERGSAVVISPQISVTDVDSPTLVSATIALSNYVNEADILSFTPTLVTGDILGSFNSDNGVMTLTSSSGATAAQFQAALRAVTYRNASSTPVSNRVASFQISDGDLASNVVTASINVTPVDDAPTLSGDDSVSYAEGQGSIVINSSITVSDNDNVSLASATILIKTGFVSGQDVLGFVPNPGTMGNIVGVFDSASGKLTLTSAGAAATLAQFQAALQSVTYQNTSGNPTSSRAITFQVNDGTLNSNVVTTSVSITPVNDAPTLSGTVTLAYTEGQSATVINPTIVVSDVDSPTLASATITITNFVPAEDVLSFAGNATTGNIAASFDTITGRLTLTSSNSPATVTQFQNALQRVSYRNSSGAPNPAARLVEYRVSDGQLSSAAATSTITITPVDDAPTITGTASISYTEGQPAVIVCPDFVVSDSDSPTLSSVTVRVASSFVAADVTLGFSNDPVSMGTIQGTYNSSTGTLLLTSGLSPATAAQFQAAVRAVTYLNSSSNPPSTSSISFQAFDGILSSNTISTKITMTPVNNAPTLSGGASMVYSEGQTATGITPLVTVADVDNSTLSAAKITILNYQSGEDILSFTSSSMTGNILGSFDSSSGVMTLTSAGATATIAQFQAALRAIAYRNASANPILVTRNVTYQVSDGNLFSNTLNSTITILPVNSAPLISGSSSLTYTEGQSPVQINSGITLSDSDNATLYSATVQFTGGLKNNQDVLGFINDSATMGNIQGTYDAVQGILLLTSSDSSATVSEFQAALRSVTYANTSANPSAVNRLVTFQVSDGGLTSNKVSSSIAVTPVNTAPTLSGTTARNYTEGQVPLIINNVIVVSDADNLTLASATVSITNYVSGEDLLAFTPIASTGNIAAAFNPLNGTLVLTSAGSTATVAQFQTALRLVTYLNSSSNPTTVNRTIDYVVNDGSLPSNTVTSTVSVSAVNSAPVITGTSNLATTEGDGPKFVSPFIVVTDADNSTLFSATVRVTTGFSATQDALGFVRDPATMGNITGSYLASTGTLTLTSAGSTASVSQFQAALRAVTYQNISGNPGASRVVTFQVSDGSLTSVPALSTITVTPVNSAPTLLGNYTLAYTEGGVASRINPVIVVADPDNTTLSSATVSITNDVSSEDVLSFAPTALTGNLVGSFDATTGVLSLTSSGASATIAQFQEALRSVSYRNTSSNPDTTTRVINFQVSDGSLMSDPCSSTITIRAVDNAPVLTGLSSLSYVEKQAATSINPNISISDIDNTTLFSATVRISTGFSAAQDVLGFANDPSTMGNITGTYDSSSGILYLNSASPRARVDQFQAALRAVTYQNISSNPTSSRQISFQVSDGILASNVITSSITIAPVDDAPVLTSSATTIYTEGSAAVSISSAITVSDVDNATLASAKVTATNFVAAEDLLSFVGTAAMGNIVGSFDSVNGVMTLTSAGATATVAQFQAALRAVSYRNVSSNPTVTTRTFTFELSDGLLTSAPQPGTVRVVAVNTPPLLTGSATLSYTEGQSAAVINPVLVITDVDNLTLSSATVSVINGFSSNQVFLGFTNDSATMGNIKGSYDVATGILTLTSADSTATVNQFQTALRSVTYLNLSLNPLTTSTVNYQVIDAGGAASNILSSTVNITPVNNAPSLTAGATSSVSYTEGSVGTAINPLITVADPDNRTLSSATVSLTNYVAGEDVLSFTSQTNLGNISGDFNSLTGTLTLFSAGSTATLAQFQNALRQVTYRNTSSTPTTTVRNVIYQVSDGSLDSNQLTSSIAVVAVNNPPKLTGSNTIDYTENQAAVALMPNIMLSDVDSPMVEMAIINFTNYTNPAEDLLEYVPAPGSPVKGNIQAGVLYLTTDSGRVSLADLQEAMRRVTYRNTSDNPNTTPRIVGFKVYDIGGQFFANSISNTVTSTVNITAVNDAPTLSTGVVLNYSENQPATAINPAITLSDPDNLNLFTATVSLTNYVASEDVLTFAPTPAQTGTITGTFDSINGVMRLNAATGTTATAPQFRAALAAVKYQNLSENPVTQPRQAVYQAFDGTALSAASTSTINVKAVNDPPSLAGTNSIIYTEGQTPTVINPILTLTDVDSSTLSYATVRISAGLAATQDVLDFIPNEQTGSITSRYSSAAGTLTLEVPAGSTATVAQFQAALRAVTYFNTSGNPATAPRSISFQVSDGAAVSTPLVSTISIISVNNPPKLSGSSALNYLENQSATVVNSNITVVDVDNTTLQSATVTLRNFVPGTEGLIFTSSSATGNIVGTFDNTSGILTLNSANASATVAQFQLALRRVTFLNVSDNPTSASRDVAFQVFDGGSFSNIVTTSLNLVPVNDPPVLSGSSVLNYTEGDSPTFVNTVINVRDPDNTTLFSATVKITTGFASQEDVLRFFSDSTTGDIIATSITGGLTLTSPSGTASLSQFQAAISRVAYVNTSSNPSVAPRTVTYQVSDGSLTSNLITSTIAVTPVNNPTLLAGESVTSYTEGTDVAVSPNLTVTDPDNKTLAAAKVSLTNYIRGEDSLILAVAGTTIGNITGSFDTSTGILTLNSAGSTATLAQFQAALRGVKYHNSSHRPDTTTRLVEYTVTDNKVGSNTLQSTVTVTAVDDNPVVSGTTNPVSFNEDSAPVPVFPNISLTDPDDTTLASATVTLTGFQATQDVLDWDRTANSANITGNFDRSTGVLTFTSANPNASLLQFQNVLKSVTYQNVSGNPTGSRTANFQVNDGTKSSLSTSVPISFIVVNDPPTLAGVSAIIYQTGTAPMPINTNITVQDVDSPSLKFATIKILNYKAGEDVISVTPSVLTSTNLTMTGSNGTWTLSPKSSSVSPAAFQTALRAVTYSNSIQATSTQPRQIEFQVNDGSVSNAVSNVTKSIITINPNYGPPVLKSVSTPIGNEGTNISLANAIKLTDSGDSYTSAQITITNYVPQKDFLSLSTTKSDIYSLISYTFDYSTGTMTLIPSSLNPRISYANMQDAMDALIFITLRRSPSRSLTVSISDGIQTSIPLTQNISIQPIIDPVYPQNSSAAIYDGTLPVPVAPALELFSYHETTLQTATLSMSGSQAIGDVLAFSKTSETGNITSIYDKTTRTLTLMSAGGTATQAQFQAAIRLVKFSNPNPQANREPASIEIKVSNSAYTSYTISNQLTFKSSANTQRPVLSGPASATYDFERGFKFVGNQFSISDPDSTTFTFISVQITSGFVTGDILSTSPNLYYLLPSYSYYYYSSTQTGILYLLPPQGKTMTLSEAETLINSIQYSNNLNDPTASRQTLMRQLAIRISDGSNLSDPFTIALNIPSTSVYPRFYGTSLATYVEGGSPAPINSAAVITPLSSAGLTSAVVYCYNWHADQDLLEFHPDPEKTGDIQTKAPSWGQMQLYSPSGTATTQQFVEAIKSITYRNSSHSPDPATRQIMTDLNWTSSRGSTYTIGTSTSLISIAPTNDAPDLGGSSTPVVYNKGQAATPVASGLSLSDVDDSTLVSAVIQFTGGFVAAEDILTFTGSADTGDIIGSFVGDTMTLISVSGTATVVQFRAAIASIKYLNTSSSPTRGDRTLSVTVSDGKPTTTPPKPLSLTLTVQ